MKRNVCTILLQHNGAKMFFDEALHPNIDELLKRDQFLEKIQDEYQIRCVGTDWVMEILDIDINK